MNTWISITRPTDLGNLSQMAGCHPVALTGRGGMVRYSLSQNPGGRNHIPGAPRTMKLTGNTSEMLRHYVGNRK
ncbi:MAG: hypothetical protein P1P80_10430, partial [ANME-2 cluster archaeon]|nr:hypothetical protein [ANME-2 cluster archaeon]